MLDSGLIAGKKFTGEGCHQILVRAERIFYPGSGRAGLLLYGIPLYPFIANKEKSSMEIAISLKLGSLLTNLEEDRPHSGPRGREEVASHYQW